MTANNFIFFLILQIPFFLISGPFLPDLTVVILSIYALTKYRDIKNYLLNNIILRYFYTLFFVSCIYFVFTSLISATPFHSLESSVFFFRFGLYSLSLIYILYKMPNIINYIFILISILIIAFFIDSTFQYIFSFNVLGFKTINNRISSFFNTELVLGSFTIKFLLIYSMIFFYKLKLKSSKKLIIIFLFVQFLSLLVIIYSGQRISLIEYFIYVVLCFLILNFNLKVKLLFFTIFIITFASSIFILKDSYQRIYNVTFDQVIENNTLILPEKYQSLYLTSLNMIKKNYLFGIGPKNFRLLCDDIKYISHPFITGSSEIEELVKKIKKDKLKKQAIDSKVGCSTHPHNKYLQIFAETGIFGFFIISIFFIYICYNLIKNFLFNYHNEYYNVLAISYISIIVIFFPLSTSGNFFNNWSNSIIFFVISIALFFVSRSHKHD